MTKKLLPIIATVTAFVVLYFIQFFKTFQQSLFGERCQLSVRPFHENIVQIVYVKYCGNSPTG